MPRMSVYVREIPPDSAMWDPVAEPALVSVESARASCVSQPGRVAPNSGPWHTFFYSAPLGVPATAPTGRRHSSRVVSTVRHKVCATVDGR